MRFALADEDELASWISAQITGDPDAFRKDQAIVGQSYPPKVLDQGTLLAHHNPTLEDITNAREEQVRKGGAIGEGWGEPSGEELRKIQQMIDDGILNPTDLDVIDPNIQQNVPVPIPVIPYNQGFDPNATGSGMAGEQIETLAEYASKNALMQQQEAQFNEQRRRAREARLGIDERIFPKSYLGGGF